MSVQPPIETGLLDLWKIRGVYLVCAYGLWIPATAKQVLKIGALRELMLEQASFVLTWSQDKLDRFVNDKLHGKGQVIPDAPDGTPDALKELWCTKYDIDPSAVDVYFNHIRK